MELLSIKAMIISTFSIGDVVNSNLCDDTFGFVVRRYHVLNDALTQMDGLAYSPYKKIYITISSSKLLMAPPQVEFLGEEGNDMGGLTREFFCIIEKDMIRQYIDVGTFKHNSVALQVTFNSLSALSMDYEFNLTF